MTVDQKIAKLRPGQSIEISRTETGYCTAERTGDGEFIKFIRHIGNTSTVYRTAKR